MRPALLLAALRAALPILLTAVPVFWALADDVVLKSGGVLHGRIEEETPEKVVLKASYGKVEIARDRIASIARKAYRPPPATPAAPPPDKGVFAPPGLSKSAASAAEPKAATSAVEPKADRAEMAAKVGSACASFGSFEYSKDAEDAANGLVALGRDIVPAILESLPEQAPPAQKWLVQVLEQIGDPAAANACLGLLSAEKGEVRGAAAKTLGALKEPRALDPLIHRLDDGDWTVRKEAAYALKALGERKALPALIARLSDVNLYTRAAAHDAICAISGEQLPADPAVCEAWLLEHPAPVEERKDFGGRPVVP